MRISLKETFSLLPTQMYENLFSLIPTFQRAFDTSSYKVRKK